MARTLLADSGDHLVCSVYPHIEEDYIRQSLGHTSYTFALGIFTKY